MAALSQGNQKLCLHFKLTLLDRVSLHLLILQCLNKLWYILYTQKVEHRVKDLCRGFESPYSTKASVKVISVNLFFYLIGQFLYAKICRLLVYIL